MELSFGELAVLLAAGAGNTPKARADLARAAAHLHSSTKYDATLALSDIKVLEQRRFLNKTRSGSLVLTQEGWAAVLHAIPVIENFRAAACNVSYRVVQ